MPSDDKTASSPSADVQPDEIMPVRSDEQIVRLRRFVREKVVEQGFSLIDQTKFVTAASELARNTLISLQRVLLGFGAGTLLGFALGAALGLSRTLEAYVLPSFNALVQIPVLGLLPFGVGTAMMAINPGFLDVLWEDPAGVKMIEVAAAAMVFGVLWMRYIVKIRV